MGLLAAMGGGYTWAFKFSDWSYELLPDGPVAWQLLWACGPLAAWSLASTLELLERAVAETFML